MSHEPVVAIAGVTGAVGAEFIATMDRRAFRVGKLKALASARSAGKTIDFRGERIVIEELTEKSFEGVDIALFSAGGGISRKFSPDRGEGRRGRDRQFLGVPHGPERAAGDPRDQRGPHPRAQGHHRRPELFGDHRAGAAVADPQGQPHQARHPLDLSGGERRRRRRDGGTGGIDPRLSRRPAVHAQGDPAPLRLQPVQPQHGVDPETGYNDEETKVIKETRKIFEDEKIAIGVTCVRVPVLRAHCEAITFECEKPITESEVRAILANAPGVRIVDDRAKNYFPMPIDASGQDDVLVGRIRKDLSDPTGHSISMFVSADQLLKGAALNAIQIAELLPQRAMA